MNIIIFYKKITNNKPVAQTGGHGASKTKVMGSILKKYNSDQMCILNSK